MKTLGVFAEIYPVPTSKKRVAVEKKVCWILLSGLFFSVKNFCNELPGTSSYHDMCQIHVLSKMLRFWLPSEVEAKWLSTHLVGG